MPFLAFNLQYPIVNTTIAWKDSSPKLCVEWDVKPCTLTHSLTHPASSTRAVKVFVCVFGLFQRDSHLSSEAVAPVAAVSREIGKYCCGMHL